MGGLFLSLAAVGEAPESQTTSPSGEHSTSPALGTRTPGTERGYAQD